MPVTQTSLHSVAAPPSDRFAEIRMHFPGAMAAPYFDTASRGLVPPEAKAAIDAQIDLRIHGTIDKTRMFATIERVRAAYAALIKARPDEIAYTKNVSEGLNIVAHGVSWRAGDNVILCPELEHPSNIYPWLHLKSRFGIDVRNLPARHGRIPVDEMIAAMNPRTRVVTCSLVTFAPGLRTDVQRLAEACAERDVLLLVDAAQGIGIIDVDMERTPIAAMSVSTQKGLLGLYGMGFLYVRKAWAERLEPPFLSRFSVDLGSAHEATGGGDNYALMPGARRFEIGNYNFIAAAAVEPGLNLIAGVTTREIESHVLRVSETMIRSLTELGLPVFASEPGIHRGHIVAIGDAIGSTHDGTDDPLMQSLYRTLSENGVRLTIRRGILRLSLHFYNNDEDIQHLVDIVRSWRAKQAA